jgi:hypothetical protein
MRLRIRSAPQQPVLYRTLAHQCAGFAQHQAPDHGTQAKRKGSELNLPTPRHKFFFSATQRENR